MLEVFQYSKLIEIGLPFSCLKYRKYAWIAHFRCHSQLSVEFQTILQFSSSIFFLLLRILASNQFQFEAILEMSVFKKRPFSALQNVLYKREWSHLDVYINSIYHGYNAALYFWFSFESICWIHPSCRTGVMFQCFQEIQTKHKWLSIFSGRTWPMYIQ